MTTTTYAEDTLNFRAAIERRDWFRAAEILGWYAATSADAQDWLSHGDIDAMLTTDLRTLAAEWADTDEDEDEDEE